MIYYINILLIVILFYMIAKMYNAKEGLISELNKPPNGIPDVPYDSLCMVTGLMGLPVNKYGLLRTRCAFDKRDTQPDTSNTCTS
jgi:hypothetical protein